MKKNLSSCASGKLEALIEKGESLLCDWNHLELKKEVFSSFKSFLESLEEGDSLFYAKNLKEKISLSLEEKAFQAFLVPFKREHSRLILKDNLKVEEGDKEGFVRDLPPLYFILDHLRSAHNVGSLLRLADCVGAKVFLLGYTPGAEHPKVAKSSMGCEKSVEVIHEKEPQKLFLDLKRKGVEIFGLETEKQAKDLFQWSPGKGKAGVALLVGNERHGISYDLLKLCDGIVRIPVFGAKNSLNVSNALSVVSYELRRQQAES